MSRGVSGGSVTASSWSGDGSGGGWLGGLLVDLLWPISGFIGARGTLLLLVLLPDIMLTYEFLTVPEVEQEIDSAEDFCHKYPFFRVWFLW